MLHQLNNENKKNYEEHDTQAMPSSASEFEHRLKKKHKTNYVPIIITVIIGIILGSYTGYIVRTSAQTQSTGTSSEKTSSNVISSSYGTKNMQLFPDTAVGVVRKGGIDGEGTHHLQRNGGPSQNVYITSSTINLDNLVGKKVKVWGKTYAAEKAGWLMDVGYAEIQ